MKITHNKKIYFYLVVTTILLLGFCIGGNLYLEKTANMIVANFDSIQKDIQKEDWEAALNTFNEKIDYWNQQKKIWQMFINHDEVDDIEVSFLALKGYLETHANQEATKELYLLRYNVLHVPATQSVNASNVL